MRSTLPRDKGALHRPPLVDGAGMYGHLRALQRDALAFQLNVSQTWGGIARLQFGPLTAHLVSSPAVAREVMLTQRACFDKETRGFQKLRLLLGNGLLTSDGEFWKRQRRIAQPLFRRARVGVFADAMVKATETLIEELGPSIEANAPVDMAEQMMTVTLRIVGETLFGADVSAETDRVGRAVHFLSRAVLRRIRMPFDLFESLPLPENRRAEQRMAELYQIVDGMIASRRRLREDEVGQEPRDLLTMLLNANDAETGASMSDQQLRDEVMTIFLAGHETTATAMAWVFVYLSRHAMVYKRLEAEVDAVLKGRAARASDLEHLQVSRAVIMEVMRLCPPAWTFGRHVNTEVEIGGYTLYPGELVLISPWALHRDPKVWPNPEGFDIDRFAASRIPADASFTYLPFGGGERICIGKHFAMMEMQLILVTMIQKLRFELVPGHPVEIEPLVTLKPRHGVMMTLHRRLGSAA